MLSPSRSLPHRRPVATSGSPLSNRGERVQFEVHVGNAERAGLKLSSQMLKLALAVLD
jgi:hypothetical protein